MCDAVTITLRDVTEANFEALMDMELPAHQRDLLHTNAYSIAQAKFHDCLVPRAIYQGERPVGFAMYNRADDGRRSSSAPIVDPTAPPSATSTHVIAPPPAPPTARTAGPRVRRPVRRSGTRSTAWAAD